MTVHVSDLTPEAQRRYGLDTAKTGNPGSRKRPSRTACGQCPGRCSCGESFPDHLPWERHVDEMGTTGHSRFDLDMEQGTTL